MYSPLRDYLLIESDESDAKSKSGIYLNYEWKRLPHTGIVKAIGPKVTQVSVGDHVRFNRYAFEKLSDNELIGIEKNVVAIING